MHVGSILISLASILSLGALPAWAQHTDITGYHGGGARSGRYVVPGLTAATAAGTAIDPRFNSDVPGKIYAQPLYWLPPGAAHGIVIVATENNVVAAVDSQSGKQVWATRLGPPVPESALACANIDPIGVTGTPVIDPVAGVLYLDSLQMSNNVPQHLVYALSLASGSVVSGWPLALSAALGAQGQTFRSVIQEQRSALELFGGVLFVSFSGNSGDCGSYHGWVVGVNTSSASIAGAWSTRAERGGIWAQGALSDDGVSVYTATGNTYGATSWGDGEGVFRLDTSLQHSGDTHDYFAPADWAFLDAHDQDVGSTGPLPLDLPAAGGGTQPVILQMGKSGYAYVLDRTNLGGIGGALMQVPLVQGRIITGPAVFPYGGGLAVTLIGFGGACPQSPSGTTLLTVQLTAGSPPALQLLWCEPFQGRGAPIVTTSDGASDPIVWVVGALGDKLLHAYRGDTGAPVFTSSGTGADKLGNPAPFTTPIVAEGRLYVATVNRLRAFVLGVEGDARRPGK